jgi:hypothetical protein
MYWLIAGLVIAGWMTVFVSSRSARKRTCAELRLEFQRQIDSLSAKIEVLERAAGARTVAAPASIVPGKIDSPASDALAAEEITPETLATITETISALLGRKVRVRSVKVLPVPEAAVNPWAQRGRAIVQASHDFSQRSRS